MSRCCRRLTQLPCPGAPARATPPAQSLKLHAGRRPYSQAAVQLKKPSSVTPIRRPIQPLAAAVHVDHASWQPVPALGTAQSATTTTPPASTSTTTFTRPRTGTLTPQAEHLRRLFPGLGFSNELARRILTHASHASAAQGHNAGLSFIGRRVLETHLLLMLANSPALDSADDLDAFSSHALNTYLVGEHVGRKWEIGRVLRWVPAQNKNPGDIAPQDDARSIGLYKVQGDTVAAVLGGVFRQWGASTAERMFHTRVLPHLMSGLPERFHPDVIASCKRLGGVNGPLAPRGQVKASTDSDSEAPEGVTL